MVMGYKSPLEVSAGLLLGGSVQQGVSLSPPAPASAYHLPRPDPSRHEVPVPPLLHQCPPEAPAHQFQLQEAVQVEIADQDGPEVRTLTDTKEEVGTSHILLTTSTRSEETCQRLLEEGEDQVYHDHYSGLVTTTSASEAFQASSRCGATKYYKYKELHHSLEPA